MANLVDRQLAGDLAENQITAGCQQGDIRWSLLDWLIDFTRPCGEECRAAYCHRNKRHSPTVVALNAKLSEHCST